MIALVCSLAAASFVAALALTGAVRAYAIRHGVLDNPNARSSHTIPTPRGGGLAVILATLAATAAAVTLGATSPRDAVTLGTGMIALGAIGWIDDRRHVAPAVRLSIHVAVAIWTLFRFGGLPELRLGDATLPLGVIGSAVGVLYIVWSINLFNFMDGIDGIAGSEAVLVLGTGAALLLARGDASLGAIAAAGAGAAAGFLAWNWPPAKIFLGDVGSGTLGYLVAAIAIGAERHGSVPLLAFVIVSGVFVADATVTLMRRVARGERASEAHRDHAYQRLSRALGSHRPVTLAAAGTTVILAALGGAGALVPTLLPAAFAAAAVVLAVLLLVVERRAPM
jgi:Fuc2NAc and GlcNAc transferase